MTKDEQIYDLSVENVELRQRLQAYRAVIIGLLFLLGLAMLHIFLKSYFNIDFLGGGCLPELCE